MIDIPTCVHTVSTREELEKLHTKQLLKFRIHSTYPCSNDIQCPHYIECTRALEAEQALIKEILATREHIPNKRESKQIRKERIKRGR